MDDLLMTDRSITFDELVTIRVQRLVNQTRHAESFDRYGETSWRACARLLLLRFTVLEAEAILRSRYMSLAADGSVRGGSATANDLKRWLDTLTPAQTQKLVGRLMKR